MQADSTDEISRKSQLTGQNVPFPDLISPSRQQEPLILANFISCCPRHTGSHTRFPKSKALLMTPDTATSVDKGQNARISSESMKQGVAHTASTTVSLLGKDADLSIERALCLASFFPREGFSIPHILCTPEYSKRPSKSAFLVCRSCTHPRSAES